MYYKLSKSCQIKKLSSIYEDFFGAIDNGVFVEVGAYDGESFSNTSGLADRGWGGLYIEPIKFSYENCLKRHKNNNVKVLNNAIGTEDKKVKIYQSYSVYNNDGDCAYLTTTKKSQMEIQRQVDWSTHISYVTEVCHQRRLEDVLVENNIPKNFDLLIVDVEGSEEDVLDSFNIGQWNPKMLIIEVEEDSRHYKKFDEFIERNKLLRKKIHDYGYTEELYRDHVNTIFIKPRA